ncbi:MAG: signal peptidase I [Candidatus Sulfotelmatobacter sp.]
MNDLPERRLSESPLASGQVAEDRIEDRISGDQISERSGAESPLSHDPMPPEKISATQPPKPDSQGDLSGSLQSLLGTVVIAVFVITFIVQAFQIPSPSMENTLLVGDYLLVNKLCYGAGSWADFLMPYRRIRRGDIIVFHYPVTPSQHFVKRVIGVPGDRVRLFEKQVLINGKSIDEPYAHFTRPQNDLFRDNFPRLEVAPGETPEWWLQLRKLVDHGQLIVPEGHYFVMGDNRDDSYDSRYWGFVPQGNIIGRPLLIYWSVRGDEGDPLAPSSVGDKLYHFAYALTHIFQITRWNRTLRLVK